MKTFKTQQELQDFLLREGNNAIRKAQEENLKKGVPNVYVINGKTIYQMPDGSLRTSSPFK